MLPDAPVFLLQQTFRGRPALPPIGSARVAAGQIPPGLLVDFGAVHLRGVRADAANKGSLAPLLADSATYSTPSKQRVPTAPWVGRDAPSTRTQWDTTIGECVAEQRSLGVDAITVPGVELTTGDYPNGLERQSDAIRRAWRSRRNDDPPWFASVNLHDEWIMNPAMRRFALNVLTDLPDPVGISLHIRFARRAAGFDGSSLSALRDVVRVLADDGRRVLLVRSGVVGWLAIAWGAWGFTAGLSQGSWLDSREEIRRRAGARAAPPLERYFELSILHHVVSADHQRLAGQAGYRQCPCSFCTALFSGVWNGSVAAQHDLYALADLTEAVAGSDRTARRDAVRRIVEAAQTVWATSGSPAGLSARSQPRQLGTWRSLV